MTYQGATEILSGSFAATTPAPFRDFDVKDVGVFRVLGGIVAVIRRHQAQRRDFQALAGLSPHTLKDIGIDRTAIMSGAYGSNGEVTIRQRH